MSDFTAIVLSARSVTLDLPGVVVLPWVSVLRDDTALHAARLDALASVKTQYCFFLDDDDELPENYLDILAEVADRFTQGAVMVYTDELVRDETQKTEYIRSTYEYNEERHRFGPMMLHHLVAMRTEVAQEVARTLPRGTYWTEHMLFYALGLRGPVRYVPKVGYIWNRGMTGFSRDPRIVRAGAFSMMWCRRQGRVS